MSDPEQTAREALAELVACKDSKPTARKGEFGRSWMERNAAHIVRFSDAWEAARAALATLSQAPEPPVAWRYLSRGRWYYTQQHLVAIGEVGSMPLYEHPAPSSPPSGVEPSNTAGAARLPGGEQ